MRRLSARFVIFVIYMAFLGANFTIVLYSWQSYFADSPTMHDLLKTLGALYSTQLGIVLAGIFSNERENPRIQAVPFLTALIVIVFWNATASWPLLYLVAKAGPQQMNINWMSGYWATIPEITAIFSSTALTHLFLRANPEATVTECRGT